MIILKAKDIPVKLLKYFEPVVKEKSAVFDINTKPYRGSHFAAFPIELVKTPIISTCPKYICTKCGQPRIPIIMSEQTDTRTASNGMGNGELADGSFGTTLNYVSGLSDCGCGAPYEPGWALDPFCGTGTVLEFCRLNGRNAIGFDLNPTYGKLAVKRAMLDLPQIQPGLKNITTI